jgi:hypothetical protein
MTLNRWSFRQANHAERKIDFPESFKTKKHIHNTAVGNHMIVDLKKGRRMGHSENTSATVHALRVNSFGNVVWTDSSRNERLVLGVNKVDGEISQNDWSQVDPTKEKASVMDAQGHSFSPPMNPSKRRR